MWHLPDEILKLSIFDMILKIINLGSKQHLPEANESVRVNIHFLTEVKSMLGDPVYVCYVYRNGIGKVQTPSEILNGYYLKITVL